MKVYLEFDLQDKHQEDLHYCALKGQQYRAIIRELLSELDDMEKLGVEKTHEATKEFVQGLAAGLGVVIGK